VIFHAASRGNAGAVDENEAVDPLRVAGCDVDGDSPSKGMAEEVRAHNPESVEESQNKP
jgi:hypothetical protein